MAGARAGAILLILVAGCVGPGQGPQTVTVTAAADPRDSAWTRLPELILDGVDVPANFTLVDEAKGDSLLDAFHMDQNPDWADEDLFAKDSYATESDAPARAYGAMYWGPRDEDGTLMLFALGFEDSREAHRFAESRTRCGHQRLLVSGASVMVVAWTPTPAADVDRGTSYPLVSLTSALGRAAHPVLDETAAAAAQRLDASVLCQAAPSDGNDAFEQAQPLRLGTSGPFDLGEDDADWFRFTLPEAAVVRLTVAPGDFSLRLHDEQGHQVWGMPMPWPKASQHRGGTLVANLTAGDYTLLVASCCGHPPRAYTLEIAVLVGEERFWDEDNGAAAATVLDEGASDWAEIMPAYDEDWYRFSLTATAQVELSMTSEWPATFEAWISHGTNEVARRSVRFSDETQQILLDEVLRRGTYYVRIAGGEYPADERYLLTLVIG